MNILAIECSQASASLCLAIGGKIVFSESWVAERNHDSYLFPGLQTALATLGQAPLNTILVGAGPGSYGGIRVAVAAAVGIAAVKGSAVVSLGSWDSLATHGEIIISDARRGGWTVRYPDGKITVKNSDELKAELTDDTLVCTIEAEATLKKQGLKAALYSLIPTAQGLVSTWLNLDAEQQAELAAKPAEPIYVRPPHITEAKRKPCEIS